MRRLGLLLLVASLAACGAMKDAFSAHADDAATAAGQSLTADRLAALAIQVKGMPLQASNLSRLAGVWVDYTLFASAVAEDRHLNDSATVLESMWPLVSQLKWDHFRERLLANRTALDRRAGGLGVQRRRAAGLPAHSVAGAAQRAPRDGHAEEGPDRRDSGAGQRGTWRHLRGAGPALLRRRQQGLWRIPRRLAAEAFRASLRGCRLEARARRHFAGGPVALRVSRDPAPAFVRGPRLVRSRRAGRDRGALRLGLRGRGSGKNGISPWCREPAPNCARCCRTPTPPSVTTPPW